MLYSTEYIKVKKKIVKIVEAVMNFTDLSCIALSVSLLPAPSSLPFYGKLNRYFSLTIISGIYLFSPGSFLFFWRNNGFRFCL